VQQQLLNRLLFRGLEDGEAAMTFSPGDMVEWFGISPNTARDWLGKWREENFVRPSRAEATRVRAYALTEKWEALIKMALNNATHNTS
jgi:DNA-binding PadR family transcriptional regulator